MRFLLLSSPPHTTSAVTSHNARESMFWVGQQGNLQVMFDVTFDDEDRYFTTSVIMRNVGNSQLTNVHYMRTVDTDQVGLPYHRKPNAFSV